jgi:hypothetical protein
MHLTVGLPRESRTSIALTLTILAPMPIAPLLLVFKSSFLPTILNQKTS